MTTEATTTEDLVQLELMLNRFNRLMSELSRGLITRNTFLPWEVDLLVDMQTCPLEPRRRSEIMRQYQRAVERQMETGPGPPMSLSQFLVLRAGVPAQPQGVQTQPQHTQPQ